MAKEIIGFDLDSVICATELEIFKYLEEEHNLLVGHGDFLCEEFEKAPVLTKSITADMINHIYSGDSFENVCIYPDVLEGLDMLRREGLEIAIITSRGQAPLEITTDWLSNNRVPYDHLHIVSSSKKWTTIKELDIKAFVEDKFEVLSSILKNIGPLPYGLLIRNHKWNERYWNRHVIRVFTFKQACEMILRLRKNFLEGE